MANYSTSANVILTINGKQAQKMLSQLEKDAKRLEKGIAKAAASGDKATMKKLQRELSSTQKTMEQLKGTAFNVDNVLRRLDKATPKELNRTLKTLQQQLNGIERGTKAWDVHIAKIKEVKEQLREVNEEMKPDESFSEKIMGWIDKWQMALVAAIGVITGLVMAGRKAVNAYAEMEQEMANVRKFTGMSEQDVISLNEGFKQINTRTSREELNKLAQEAGRLGKSSQEDVLGFVRAADKINVALDDLGEGATLTLSKLTGIFGDEKRLGTERALLAVGSVINELSQNCSASAPYIAEFASRMGGVGSQAGMTVQQIMGYAAVLDSNNQKLEASATALSQVIVRIYQEPEKYARVAGMNAKRFANLVKKDMNYALIEFLSTLKQAGGMDVLSPMFKDMGENGSRAISALATLANKIQEVKDQQQVANQAFREARSIDEEFNVQNNTVQASLDKAKNRVNELAVELGEKLQPVMRLVISSSTIALKVLSAIVDFIIQHKGTVISLVSAIAAYNVVILVYNTRTKLAAIATTLWNKSITLCKAVVPVFRLLIVGLSNTIQYFTNGLQVNYAMQQRWRNALKAMSFGNWAALAIAAIAAVVAIWQNLSNNIDKTKQKFNEAIGKMGDFEDAALKEREELDKLFGSLRGARKESEAYKEAKDALINQHGAYIRDLINEEGEIEDLNEAYRRLAESIRIANQERGIKNARSAVEDTFKEEISELSSQLYKTFIEYGVEVGEAAQLHAAVITSMEMGVPIDDKTQKRINELTAGKNGQVPGRNPISSVSAGIYHVTGGALGSDFKEGPAGIVNRMYDVFQMRDSALNQVDVTARVNRPLRDLEDNFLDLAIDYAESAKESGGTVLKLVNALAGTFELTEVTAEEAKAQLLDLTAEKSYRNGTNGDGNKTPTDEDENNKKYKPRGTNDKDSDTDQFAKENEWKAQQEAKARIDYATGITDYITYTNRMDEIAVQFYQKQLKHKDLSKTQRLEISAQYHEAVLKQQQHFSAQSIEEENQTYAEKLAALKQHYIDGEISKETFDRKAEEAELEHQQTLVNLYKEGTQERFDAEKQLADLQIKQMEKRQQERQQLEAKFAAMKKDFFGDNPQEKKAKYEYDLAILSQVYAREILAAGNNAKEKLRIEEAFEKAKLALKKKYGLMSEDDTKNAMERGITKSAKWLQSDGGKALTGSLDTLVSGMSSIFSQVSSFMQAELEIQTAEINKRYDAEIERAEGNAYKVKKLEIQKEKEIAQAKDEANRKMFAMQVIQAVAQTATNALNAYGSAAAIPVVGYILAPIAAAMAVAAGAMQIATIKKQQQASTAQGYAEGGFTPKGGKYEEAGVVHKGEWVASQALVNNPRTRPLLEALDYAQRTNTIGSITAADVSRTITAQAIIAAHTPEPPTIVNNTFSNNPTPESNRLADLLDRLDNRLNEPFITVNTVTGNLGIKKAQDEYKQLIRNKSPKRKK